NSAVAGSAALARNRSNSAFLALAAAVCRSRNSGSLERALPIYGWSLPDLRGDDLCDQPRVRQPILGVASMRSPVSRLCQLVFVRRRASRAHVRVIPGGDGTTECHCAS